MTSSVLQVANGVFGVAFNVRVKKGTLLFRNETDETTIDLSGRIGAQAATNGVVEETVWN